MAGLVNVDSEPSLRRGASVMPPRLCSAVTLARDIEGDLARHSESRRGSGIEFEWAGEVGARQLRLEKTHPEQTEARAAARMPAFSSSSAALPNSSLPMR